VESPPACKVVGHGEQRVGVRTMRTCMWLRGGKWEPSRGTEDCSLLRGQTRRSTACTRGNTARAHATRTWALVGAWGDPSTAAVPPPATAGPRPGPGPGPRPPGLWPRLRRRPFMSYSSGAGRRWRRRGSASPSLVVPWEGVGGLPPPRRPVRAGDRGEVSRAGATTKGGRGAAEAPPPAALRHAALRLAGSSAW